MEQQEKQNWLEACGITGPDVEEVVMCLKRASMRESAPEKLAKLLELEDKFVRLGVCMGSCRCTMILGEVYQGQLSQAAKACADPLGEAIRLWERAGQMGDARGYTNIGLLYLHKPIPGGGDSFGDLPLDAKKALEYLQKAHEMGDFKAGRHIGLCYLEGNGLEKSAEKAYEWFCIASGRGDSSATLFKADCLLQGVGVAQDVPKALEIYKALVECRGHDVTNAAYALGCIYRDGVYTPQNPALAKQYFESAVQTATALEAEVRAKAQQALAAL